MRRARAWLLRLGGFFHRGRGDRELADELESHLQMHIDDNLRSGMTPGAARRNALIKLGGIDATTEAMRDRRSLPILEALAQDLRYGLRMLRRSPRFTAVAALTLGLGIGVNTSMFSAIRATFKHPLPYPEAGRIVRLFGVSSDSRRNPHSTPNFLDYRAQNSVFESMTALNSRQFSLAAPGEPPERVRGVEATADLFAVLGVNPELGRAFTAEEELPGQNGVVILSHRLWLRRFAGDTNIVGRALRLDGAPVVVIGVAPAGFDDPRLAGRSDLWRPLVLKDGHAGRRGDHWLLANGRLKPGVSLAQAQVGLDSLAARMAKDYPETDAERGLRIVSLANSGNENGLGMVWLVMGLAGFVLLIACANLANLQLARTSGRARELAIRGALGAHRGRLLRQLLTECLLIAFIGGLSGLALAKWGNAILGRQITWGTETGVNLPLDLTVLTFALAATTLAGLVFGVAPAWLAARADVNDTLKQGGRGATGGRSQHRLQHGLIVAEVALALALLAGAGMVGGGLRRYIARDPGWRVEGLSFGSISLPEIRYGSDVQRVDFADRLRERLAALPGVEGVALSWFLPVRRFDVISTFVVEGRPEPPPGREPSYFHNAIAPGFFRAFGTPLLQGREFNGADTTNRPAVVIINETMARAFWPGESAIGKRVGGPDAWLEVVGVVGDVRFPGELDEPVTRFQAYRPLAQEPPGNLSIALRGNVSSASLRRVVSELDPDLPVNDTGTARAAIEQLQSDYTVIGWLLTGFAGLGLLLASLGIYGVIAGFVAQRTNEIGVRMALGARRADVLRLVLGKGLRLAALGVLIGLFGAAGIARLLASASPTLVSKSPLTVIAVAGLLMVVAALACWFPARRAARVDPMTALRAD